MNATDIENLLSSGYYLDEPIKGILKETHISWIILTRRHAFKIKKPVKLSFLDFSTLGKRKYYCEREVRLNSRFSDIYKGVLPVSHNGAVWSIGRSFRHHKDYAVVMRRMRESKNMRSLLKNNDVTVEQILTLVSVLSKFHRRAPICLMPFGKNEQMEAFNDLRSVQDIVQAWKFPDKFNTIINAALKWNKSFLDANWTRMKKRQDDGFYRDVHGDLHAANIFLYKKPVLFDCIEYKDSFRKIDLLDEVAFLCMDMESFGRHQLAQELIVEYNKTLEVLRDSHDEKIFNYYKCMRANIRAKVSAINARTNADASRSGELIKEVRKYLMLITQYMSN